MNIRTYFFKKKQQNRQKKISALIRFRVFCVVCWTFYSCSSKLYALLPGLLCNTFKTENLTMYATHKHLCQLILRFFCVWQLYSPGTIYIDIDVWRICNTLPQCDKHVFEILSCMTKLEPKQVSELTDRPTDKVIPIKPSPYTCTCLVVFKQ